MRRFLYLRSSFVKASAWLLLAAPFVLLVFAGGEVFVRWKGRDLTPPFQRCLAYDLELHHLYLPGCSSTTPLAGEEIEYAFNEDGFRDRPRKEFSSGPGTVAVVGDSITEGFFLPVDATLPRLLEKRLGRGRGLMFLNAGVRFTSPILQFRQLQKQIEPNYRLKALVLLLNASDTTDERLFQAETIHRDKQGLPELFPWLGNYSLGASLLIKVNQWNQGRSQLLESFTRYGVFRIYLERAHSMPPSEEVLCSGLQRFARAAHEKRIPLLIAFTPHFREGIEANWAGEPHQPEHLATMINCARGTGAAVVDLSKEELRADWFFADKLHYSRSGMEWLAGRLAPQVESLIGSARSDPRR